MKIYTIISVVLASAIQYNARNLSNEMKLPQILVESNIIKNTKINKCLRTWQD